jgi:5-methylcytosine-specific restriction enzyme A
MSRKILFFDVLHGGALILEKSIIDVTNCIRLSIIPGMKSDYFICADEQHLRREKARARALRSSQWWKRKRADGVCHYCGNKFKPSELTMDHLVPIVRGGGSVRGNVVPACKECNSKKRYLLPTEWEEYLLTIRNGGE